jgi:hypothetical protein
MKYQVERHSGRNGTEFRTLIDTDDGEKARSKYEDVALCLRQGTVRLLIDGTVANVTSSPRLRTRW